MAFRAADYSVGDRVRVEQDAGRTVEATVVSVSSGYIVCRDSGGATFAVYDHKAGYLGIEVTKMDMIEVESPNGTVIKIDPEGDEATAGTFARATSMAFSNKCPVCGKDVDVNNNGRFVGHAGKSGNCPASGKTIPEARNMDIELDAVDFATSARCPYCTSAVGMSRRTLSDHRTYGGACDGSGRRVAEFDSAGRVVLEPR